MEKRRKIFLQLLQYVFYRCPGLLKIFQQLPIYIRKRILKEGKILLDKNSDLLYELAFATIKEFELFEKMYKMYLNEVENG